MCKFMARKGSRRKEVKKTRLFGELKKARDRRMVCVCHKEAGLTTVLDELSHLERRSIAIGKCFYISKSSGSQT